MSEETRLKQRLLKPDGDYGAVGASAASSSTLSQLRSGAAAASSSTSDRYSPPQPLTMQPSASFPPFMRQASSDRTPSPPIEFANFNAIENQWLRDLIQALTFKLWSKPEGERVPGHAYYTAKEQAEQVIIVLLNQMKEWISKNTTAAVFPTVDQILQYYLSRTTGADKSLSPDQWDSALFKEKNVTLENITQAIAVLQAHYGLPLSADVDRYREAQQSSILTRLGLSQPVAETKESKYGVVATTSASASTITPATTVAPTTTTATSAAAATAIATPAITPQPLTPDKALDLMLQKLTTQPGNAHPEVKLSTKEIILAAMRLFAEQKKRVDAAKLSLPSFSARTVGVDESATQEAWKAFIAAETVLRTMQHKFWHKCSAVAAKTKHSTGFSATYEHDVTVLKDDARTAIKEIIHRQYSDRKEALQLLTSSSTLRSILEQKNAIVTEKWLPKVLDFVFDNERTEFDRDDLRALPQIGGISRKLAQFGLIRATTQNEVSLGILKDIILQRFDDSDLVALLSEYKLLPRGNVRGALEDDIFKINRKLRKAREYLKQVKNTSEAKSQDQTALNNCVIKINQAVHIAAQIFDGALDKNKLINDLATKIITDPQQKEAALFYLQNASSGEFKPIFDDDNSLQLAAPADEETRRNVENEILGRFFPLEAKALSEEEKKQLPQAQEGPTPEQKLDNILDKLRKGEAKLSKRDAITVALRLFAAQQAKIDSTKDDLQKEINQGEKKKSEYTQQALLRHETALVKMQHKFWHKCPAVVVRTEISGTIVRSIGARDHVVAIIGSYANKRQALKLVTTSPTLRKLIDRLPPENATDDNFSKILNLILDFERTEITENGQLSVVPPKRKILEGFQGCGLILTDQDASSLLRDILFQRFDDTPMVAELSKEGEILQAKGSSPDAGAVLEINQRLQAAARDLKASRVAQEMNNPDNALGKVKSKLEGFLKKDNPLTIFNDLIRNAQEIKQDQTIIAAVKILSQESGSKISASLRQLSTAQANLDDFTPEKLRSKKTFNELNDWVLGFKSAFEDFRNKSHDVIASANAKVVDPAKKLSYSVPTTSKFSFINSKLGQLEDVGDKFKGNVSAVIQNVAALLETVSMMPELSNQLRLVLNSLNDASQEENIQVALGHINAAVYHIKDLPKFDTQLLREAKEEYNKAALILGTVFTPPPGKTDADFLRLIRSSRDDMRVSLQRRLGGKEPRKPQKLNWKDHLRDFFFTPTHKNPNMHSVWTRSWGQYNVQLCRFKALHDNPEQLDVANKKLWWDNPRDLFFGYRQYFESDKTNWWAVANPVHWIDWGFGVAYGALDVLSAVGISPKPSRPGEIEQSTWGWACKIASFIIRLGVKTAQSIWDNFIGIITIYPFFIEPILRIINAKIGVFEKICLVVARLVTIGLVVAALLSGVGAVFSGPIAAACGSLSSAMLAPFFGSAIASLPTVPLAFTLSGIANFASFVVEGISSIFKKHVAHVPGVPMSLTSVEAYYQASREEAPLDQAKRPRSDETLESSQLSLRARPRLDTLASLSSFEELESSDSSSIRSPSAPAVLSLALASPPVSPGPGAEAALLASTRSPTPPTPPAPPAPSGTFADYSSVPSELRETKAAAKVDTCEDLQLDLIKRRDELLASIQRCRGKRGLEGTIKQLQEKVDEINTVAHEVESYITGYNEKTKLMPSGAASSAPHIK